MASGCAQEAPHESLVSRGCCRWGICVQVPLVAGNALLVGRQLAGMAANLTANEMLVRQRYPYLHAPDGTYLNLFDRGLVGNCAQWWSSERPDWDAEYASRQQVQVSCLICS